MLVREGIFEEMMFKDRKDLVIIQTCGSEGSEIAIEWHMCKYSGREKNLAYSSNWKKTVPLELNEWK